MLGITPNPVETAQDVLMRETAAEIGRESTYRPTDVARLFREGGRAGRRPLFRGRRARPHRLRALRRVHDRLPQGRQEQPGQELSLLRREVRRPRLRREPGRRHRAARRPTAARATSSGRARRRACCAAGAASSFRTKGLVLAAGALGTNTLLLDMKRTGRLPESLRTSRTLRPDQQRDPARRALLLAGDRFHPGRGHHLERPSRR